jgi:hypothetical protein
LEMTRAEALKSPSCRRSPGLAARWGAWGIGSKTSLQGGGRAGAGEDGEGRGLLDDVVTYRAPIHLGQRATMHGGHRGLRQVSNYG